MTSELAELLHTVRRTIDWHRRTFAALLAGVAVLASLSALSPKRPPTRAVWAAAHDLAGGITAARRRHRADAPAR